MVINDNMKKESLVLIPMIVFCVGAAIASFFIKNSSIGFRIFSCSLWCIPALLGILSFIKTFFYKLTITSEKIILREWFKTREVNTTEVNKIGRLQATSLGLHIYCIGFKNGKEMIFKTRYMKECDELLTSIIMKNKESANC